MKEKDEEARMEEKQAAYRRIQDKEFADLDAFIESEVRRMEEERKAAEKQLKDSEEKGHVGSKKNKS